jgi:hypothetical protein
VVAPIGAMPGCFRVGWRNGLLDEVRKARDVGVNQVVLFPVVSNVLKVRFQRNRNIIPSYEVAFLGASTDLLLSLLAEVRLRIANLACRAASKSNASGE